jgi:hypothetical protein
MFAFPMPEEDFKNLPKHEYKNVDELLADGWIVD